MTSKWNSQAYLDAHAALRTHRLGRLLELANQIDIDPDLRRSAIIEAAGRRPVSAKITAHVRSLLTSKDCGDIRAGGFAARELGRHAAWAFPIIERLLMDVISPGAAKRLKFRRWRTYGAVNLAEPLCYAVVKLGRRRAARQVLYRVICSAADFLVISRALAAVRDTRPPRNDPAAIPAMLKLLKYRVERHRLQGMFYFYLNPAVPEAIPILRRLAKTSSAPDRRAAGILLNRVREACGQT